ncbi:hypothetical protein KUCAC02_013374 [Chaenocephalus aceratus]|nr:hypothetical protein KUCAC02_013374 [Chaenocephalus aceratus]
MQGTHAVRDLMELWTACPPFMTATWFCGVERKGSWTSITGWLSLRIVVSPTEKTWYRYYCEAVMMLRHFQRPGAVEGMTVREWVNRKLTDGRYLIGIKNHKTGATHVATIALTLEEEARDTDHEWLNCGIDHGGLHKVADLMADTHYRRPGPSTIVAHSCPLDTLPGHFLFQGTASHQQRSRGSKQGFQRTVYTTTGAGKGQYADRQEHLLSHFTYRKPSGGKIERLISKEGWTSNCPKKWKGLAIKSFDGQKGEGVVATTHFTEGDIVCDYHGKVITKAEGEMMMKDQGDQAGYLFFFNAGGEALCIDAQTWPCPCHDGDVHTILFKATRDIKVDTELKFNYGVNRTSFRGEALHLDWLDE